MSDVHAPRGFEAIVAPESLFRLNKLAQLLWLLDLLADHFAELVALLIAQVRLDRVKELVYVARVKTAGFVGLLCADCGHDRAKVC